MKIQPSVVTDPMVPPRGSRKQPYGVNRRRVGSHTLIPARRIPLRRLTPPRESGLAGRYGRTPPVRASAWLLDPRVCVLPFWPSAGVSVVGLGSGTNVTE